MYSITEGFSPILYCRPDVVTLGNPFDTMMFESLGFFFVETSKSRPTHARLRNRELADEAELVSLSVG